MANLLVGLGADDWQWLPDLFYADTILEKSATTFRYTNQNGHTVQISGSGFIYSGDEPTGGTLTAITIVDGAESVLTITGASSSLKAFAELLADGDSFAAMGLVLNGDDVITGSSESNSLAGYRGDDKIDGKAGQDQLDYSEDAAYGGKKGIKVDLSKGQIRDPYGDTDRIKNVESIVGTQKKDVFIGSNKNDVFKGLDGKDKYDGGKGFDQIAFNHNDWNGGTNGVSINVAKGKILDDGYGNTEKFKGIESFHGTKFDDVFVGSKKGDEFKGEGGNDIMTGGKGGDTFVFNPPPDSTNNHDVITDFNEDEGDRIALWTQDGFPQLTEVGGGLDPAQFIANAGGTPNTADQRIVYDTTSGKLWLDPDGNTTSGDQILIATLTNKPTLTIDAFEVWV